jgi:hypothetical protein
VPAQQAQQQAQQQVQQAQQALKMVMSSRPGSGVV